MAGSKKKKKSKSKGQTRAKSPPRRTATKKPRKKSTRPTKKASPAKRVAAKTFSAKKGSAKKVPARRVLAGKLPAKKKAAVKTVEPQAPKTFAENVRDCDAGTAIWFIVAGGIEHAVIQGRGSDGAVAILTDAGVTEVVPVGNLFETAGEARAARYR